MTVLEHAIKLIESYGDDFDTIIADYMQNGYVYVSNILFGLAKREGNDLFIYLIVGSIDDLVNKIDFIPENITCYRRGIFKTFNYKKLISKIPNR